MEIKNGAGQRPHAETGLLSELRKLRRRARETEGLDPPEPKLTLGQRIADTVAATMGSWNFILIQSAILFVWIVLNVTAWVRAWDPYPFILLNLRSPSRPPTPRPSS